MENREASYTAPTPNMQGFPINQQANCFLQTNRREIQKLFFKNVIYRVIAKATCFAVRQSTPQRNARKERNTKKWLLL